MASVVISKVNKHKRKRRLTPDNDEMAAEWRGWAACSRSERGMANAVRRRGRGGSLATARSWVADSECQCDDCAAWGNVVSR